MPCCSRSPPTTAPTFDRIWGWTRANLMVRDDALLAWRWEPGKRPAVADMNNASDGDILVAWALAEAGEFWGDMSYRTAARRIAVEIGRKTRAVQDQARRAAAAGRVRVSRRATARTARSSICPIGCSRPSRACRCVAPEVDWRGLDPERASTLLKDVEFRRRRPAGRMGVAEGRTAKPADGFPRAVLLQRHPHSALYRLGRASASANTTSRSHALGDALSRMAIIDVDGPRSRNVRRRRIWHDRGSADLCASRGSPLGATCARFAHAENYYPATLRLLAIPAAQMRFPSCLRG